MFSNCVLISRTLLATVALASACGLQGTQGEPQSTNFALSPTSCPVTTEIQDLMWDVERDGSRLVKSFKITRTEIDRHCSAVAAGSLADKLATIDLTPGTYLSLVSALDRSGVVVNDLDAASSTFTIQRGQTTSVSATIKAATGTAKANGSWTIDNASFEDDTAIGSGCCCPAMCKGESVVGCKRATNNGICTGWTDPCGC
ncbi:MAG: hypothetical protein HYY84_13440 [Deltaproteobacteria bacterium]|nr:hypothetical protein [Deltaproteobacteria bacterium]